MRVIDDATPSLQDWRDLYAAAVELKKLEPWTWMYDDQVFGVQNPANGEIGYCCVMGALGELFGLAVYLGEEGLEGYHNIQSGKVSGEDVLFAQDCLITSYEDRKALDPQDLEIIKRLGLKFRGRNAWPAFRSHIPGYFPWHLGQGEAQFLKIAIDQAQEVALMVRDDERILNPVHEGHYLVRTPRAEGGRLIWENQSTRPPRPAEKAPKEEPATPVDELLLERLKEKNPQRDSAWEIDLFFSPMPVREGKERPYFPQMALFADHHSGYVLGTTLLNPSEVRSAFQKQVGKLLEESKSFPEQVLVSNKKVQELIAPIVAGLGIELKMVKKLKALEKVRYSLFDRFLR